MPASVEVNGAKIEHLRKVRIGLSRRDAARVLNMSEVGLYYIERGRGRGSSKVSRTQPDTLQRIAALLRANPEELTEDESEANGKAGGEANGEVDGEAGSLKPVVA